MIDVIDCGLADYEKILNLQNSLFLERVSQKKQGLSISDEKILLVEHPHVFTMGVHANVNNLLVDTSWLDANGIKCVSIKRGGDITYHGPGQIVVYPIIDLSKRNLGVKDYVNILEQAVINAIALYGVIGERVEGATGVWIGKNTPYERKICAIGIRCSRYITMHGLALNVNTDLTYFSRINPCGFVDKPVTSLSKEAGHKLDMSLVKKQLTEELLKLL